MCGIPAVDGLSLTSTGAWILVLGAARALFEAAAGLRATERGQLLVAGMTPLDAVRARVMACAPLDPPLPPRWTVDEYATWSARLAGQRRVAARARAAEAIERLGLASFGATRLGGATATIRRGAVLAAALATGASILLLEDPAFGLAGELGHAFARAVVDGLSDRRVAFFAASARLDSPPAMAADEAIVMDGSSVVSQGSPAAIAAAERDFGLRVEGDITAFVTALRAAGGELLTEPATTATASASHVTVSLGALRTGDLLRIAEESNAVVIELRPLARAFA